MERATIVETVRHLIAESTASEQEIPLEATFLELGLDSIQQVDLISRLEEQLGVTFDPGTFSETQSIAELVDYIAQQQPA